MTHVSISTEFGEKKKHFVHWTENKSRGSSRRVGFLRLEPYPRTLLFLVGFFCGDQDRSQKLQLILSEDQFPMEKKTHFRQNQWSPWDRPHLWHPLPSSGDPKITVSFNNVPEGLNSLKAIILIVMVYYSGRIQTKVTGRTPSTESRKIQVADRLFVLLQYSHGRSWLFPVTVWQDTQRVSQESSPKPWYPGFLLGLSHRDTVDHPCSWSLVSSPSRGQPDPQGSKLPP